MPKLSGEKWTESCQIQILFEKLPPSVLFEKLPPSVSFEKLQFDLKKLWSLKTFPPRFRSGTNTSISTWMIGPVTSPGYGFNNRGWDVKPATKRLLNGQHGQGLGLAEMLLGLCLGGNVRVSILDSSFNLVSSFNV